MQTINHQVFEQVYIPKHLWLRSSSWDGGPQRFANEEHSAFINLTFYYKYLRIFAKFRSLKVRNFKRANSYSLWNHQKTWWFQGKYKWIRLISAEEFGDDTLVTRPLHYPKYPQPLEQRSYWEILTSLESHQLVLWWCRDYYGDHTCIGCTMRATFFIYINKTWKNVVQTNID